MGETVPALLEAGYRVITYDRRGFGHSSKPAKGYDYDTLAKDLGTLMTTLNLNDAVLVGFSMGGGEVARYLGTVGSQRVSGAVFVSAVPPFLLKTADNPDGVDGSVFEGIMQGIIADRPAFLTAFFNNFYNVDIFRSKLISEEAIRLSWNIAAMASAKGTLDCVSAWLTDFRNDLKKIAVPTLVVHGDADRILSFRGHGKAHPRSYPGKQACGSGRRASRPELDPCRRAEPGAAGFSQNAAGAGEVCRSGNIIEKNALIFFEPCKIPGN